MKYRYGIVDRNSSSEFLSLDGEWEIKQHSRPEEAEIGEELDGRIPVPSSVQMHGYDRLQYLNCRYPPSFAFLLTFRMKTLRGITASVFRLRKRIGRTICTLKGWTAFTTSISTKNLSAIPKYPTQQVRFA